MKKDYKKYEFLEERYGKGIEALIDQLLLVDDSEVEAKVNNLDIEISKEFYEQFLQMSEGPTKLYYQTLGYAKARECKELKAIAVRMLFLFKRYQPN